MTATADGNYWRCWKCGAHGDAIDLLRLDGRGFRDALAALGLDGDPSFASARPPQRPPAEREREARRRELASLVQCEGVERTPAWLDLAGGIAAEARQALWLGSGREARAYLRARGISERVARAAGIGYIPKAIPLPAWLAHPGEDRLPVLPSGLTIPWAPGSDRIPWVPPAPGDVTALKIRRLGPGTGPKYVSLRGSSYGSPYPRSTTARGGCPLLIVEGEFDALALWTALAGLPIGVVTFGGATTRPLEWAADLAATASMWILGHDADDAGDAAAERWARLARLGGIGCVRERPGRKDWSDVIAATGAEAVRRHFAETFDLVPKSLADA